MSVHRGVSCDKCGRSGFTGKRYKCLLCFDFDLCADCFDSLGDETANNGRHTSSHPVQCILTRTDMSLYYGGENSAEYSYSFTCPYCAVPGYTEQTLHDHVNTQHPDQRTEVVCPVCAALPDGDANFISDDFQEHLAIEHQAVKEVDESSHRLIRRIHQRGGRMKGYHRLYANAYQPPPSSGSANSLFNSGYLPRKERGSGVSHQHGGEADPLADLLSQLTTSHRDNIQLHSAGMTNFDSFNEDRFEQLAKQYTDHSKYALNQFYDKPSSHEAKNPFLYKPPGDTPLGKGGKDHVKSKQSAIQVAVPLKVMSKQIKEMSKESEEKKEAFDEKRAAQAMFLTELLISSLTEDFRYSSSSDDDIYTN
ncbi:E3 ubiquitin-protein ligase KCMF1-like isoform X1 [Oopsacas minuta]|uniref:RING-type E3 ubiquitin transferase n=1 Tax=Oopsacas minuta TaxID=111878 RepID=A0AAV7KJB3_9METZ|nr:E3 ubiquitin-protein ligase KCMF1-like isoform X1 [Oopsacas minuta]